MKLYKKRILDNFPDMIRLKTVSYADPSMADEAAFSAFRALLKSRYPAVAGNAEIREIGRTGLVFRIPGKSGDAPSVLMAHYDVVPANDAGWTVDPFGAEIIDGRIYGRGTLDTKATVCAIMEAAEAALSAGFVPRNDLYLVFGGEEETCGGTMPEIVRTFEEEGIYPSFVLDEGGAVVPEGVPGLKRQAAMIGIAEKGTAQFLLRAVGQVGHASTPRGDSAIGRLAGALKKIEEHPFPVRLSSAVRTMFRELSSEVPGYAQPVFAHPGMMQLPLKAVGSRFGATVNAMLRTTVVPVRLQAGSAGNVIPAEAEAVLSVRLLEGDTMESAAKRIEKIIDDKDVIVSVESGSEASPVSDIDGEEWENLKKVIHNVWPEAVTAPFQMNGGTDARHFTDICRHVYRFTPIEMSEKERASVHGINESISVDQLFKTVVFYARLILTL